MSLSDLLLLRFQQNIVNRSWISTQTLMANFSCFDSEVFFALCFVFCLGGPGSSDCSGGLGFLVCLAGLGFQFV